jgi:DNA-directed RNA polymerase specialized sigma24 family protein
LANELCALREEYGSAYQKWFPSTVRFLVSRGLSDDTAKEIAQAAWVRGWQCRSQLRDAAFLLTWVNSIAANLHHRFMRYEQRYLTISESAVAPSVDHLSIDVSQVLSGCPPVDRTILKQFHLEERPIREIARQHCCSVTAMRIRLVRARRSARAHFRPTTRSRAAVNLRSE